MSTCHYLTGQDTHLAAYKRTVTVQFRRGRFITRHITNTFPTFSLYSVGSNSNKLRKLKRFFTNPNGFRSKDWTRISVIFVQTLRDSFESSSWSSDPCNSSAKFTAKSNESGTITESGGLRRRGWRIQRFRTGWEEEQRGYRFIFGFKPEINKQNQFQRVFKDFSSNLRLKPGINRILTFFSVQEQQRTLGWCRSTRIRKVLVQDHKTLRFSREPSRFQGLQRISIVVNQRINEQKCLEERFEPKKIEPKPFGIRE